MISILKLEKKQGQQYSGILRFIIEGEDLMQQMDTKLQKHIRKSPQIFEVSSRSAPFQFKHSSKHHNIDQYYDVLKNA